MTAGSALLLTRHKPMCTTRIGRGSRAATESASDRGVQRPLEGPGRFVDDDSRPANLGCILTCPIVQMLRVQRTSSTQTGSAAILRSAVQSNQGLVQPGPLPGFGGRSGETVHPCRGFADMRPCTDAAKVSGVRVLPPRRGFGPSGNAAACPLHHWGDNRNTGSRERDTTRKRHRDGDRSVSRITKVADAPSS